MTGNYNEKLEEKISEMIHLLTYHLAQEKRYQLLNVKALNEDSLDLWVESLRQKDFSFTDCKKNDCLWNIAKAPH